MPSLNKPLVLELARCEFVVARDNIVVLGNSGTGKTHIALALGLAACQRGFSVAFATSAGLVHQLQEARDERRLLPLQQNLATAKLLPGYGFGSKCGRPPRVKSAFEAELSYRL